jgi:hypothetical protein
MAHSSGDPFGEDHDALFDADVNAVLDFRYSPSPRLQWWCDHHQTAFLSPEHRRHFEAHPSSRKRFDPEAPSCAGLLVRWLEADHGFSQPTFADHAAWADRVDSAAFASPSQAVELAEPALQLMMLLESAPGPALTDGLIRGLADGSLEQVHARPEVQQALAPVLRRHRETVELFRERLTVRQGVGIFDLSEDGVEGFNKFIPYYLEPSLRYTVGLTRSPRRAKVSVGSNPWQRPEPLVNLGQLCRRFGGGGHAVVGAVSLAPERLADARRAFEQIQQTLVESGSGRSTSTEG